jgi:Leu/Phe-tRNA-protein transferase
MQSKIYYITPDIIKDKNYFHQMCENREICYYWSDNWSESFYIELAKAGFISVTHETPDTLLLLPELQHEYALLDFKDLHISKKVKKLLQKTSYEFCINSQFKQVIENLSLQHKNNWLKKEYTELVTSLYLKNHTRDDFKMLSVELVCKESGSLIVGEVGYIIGKTYTSLSGFSSKEKQYANYGTLQLVLLSKYLEGEGFLFWNLGHPHMEYKKRLGCKVYTRSAFLKRWEDAIN